MDENQILESNQPQASQKISLKEQLTTVTAFSKYLALSLFVILPFVGFWIGMNSESTESLTENTFSNTSTTTDIPITSAPIVNVDAMQQDITIDEGNVATTSPSQSESKIVWLDGMNKYTFNNGYVYLNDVKIEGADVHSFQIVTENPFPKGKYSGDDVAHYAKDKSNVYYDGKVINGALGSSFKVVWADAIVSEQVYAQDERNVYYQGEVLVPQADPTSFVPLGALSNSWRVGGSYSHDGNHVYYENREVIGADWHTFNSEYEDGYASDKDNVFLEGKIIPNLNPENFTFPVHEP